MIDTHAHLTSPAFSHDLPAVLARATTAGLHSILTVSESLADAHAVLALCAAHGGPVRPALGLHPEHLTALPAAACAAELAAVSHLIAASPAVAAIGEVGLDHTPRVLAASPVPSPAAKQRQAAVFAHFLRLSARLALPVTVHSRGAGRAALQLVVAAARDAPVAVCMHAFDGRPIHAERALRDVPHGLYFSVPPSVVRGQGLARLVHRVDMARLVLESDAPALGPCAGERNEPANVRLGVEEIARIKGLGVAAVREALMANTLRLFPKLGVAGVLDG